MKDGGYYKIADGVVAICGFYESGSPKWCFIVVAHHPMEGLRFFGPFVSEQKAEEWKIHEADAEIREEDGTIDGWLFKVQPLATPYHWVIEE